MSVSASTPSRGPSGEPAASAFRRALPVALVLTLGLALSLGIFLLVRQWDRERTEREFEWRLRREAQALEITLRGYEECLYTLRSLYDSSDSVELAEFQRAARDLRARHPGIELLQWVERVPHARRAEFETWARGAVGPDFAISSGAEKNAGGSIVRDPREPAAEYAVTTYIEPPGPNDVALGFDLFCGPHAGLLAEAVAAGQFRASPRVGFRAETGRAQGWVVFLPVYAAETPPLPEARRAGWRGCVEGAFRLDDLFAPHRLAGLETGLDLLLMDETPGTPQPFLLHSREGLAQTAAGRAPTPEEFQRSGLSRSFPLAVQGRDWRLWGRPTPEWLAAQRTSFAFAFLATGVLLTGLLTSILRSTQRRRATVEKLVAQRTAELRAVQEELRGDIRERAAAEQALRASDDRYRAFVGQSTEGIWRIENDPPIPTGLPVEEQIALLYRHGWLAECNDAMARMYGYASAREIVGLRVGDITPQDDPLNLAYHRAFVAGGYRLADWETREADKDGNVKYFLNNETGIVEDGLFKRAWGTQRDVTRRKLAEEARREQETRLRLAIGAARLGTWESDLRTHHVTWAPETEAMFGLAPGTFDGKLETYFSFIHPEDLEPLKASIQRAIAAPVSDAGTDHQLRIVRRDGTQRWLVARGVVIRDAAGQPLRMIGAVIDVTAQHQAEEERTLIERKLQQTQKLESLGVLAGGIAHDFNNLLTAVLGNASLARLELPPDSPAQESLAQIEAGAQRAAELCKQMLAYSGKGRFLVRRLDLSAVVRDTTELVRLSISKNAVLKFALAPDLPAITADATQLRQIVMNLVINASDAIAEKSGVIALSTGVLHADRAYLAETHLAPGIPEGRYVFLEVSDNGTGMSAETKAKIFDPFFTTKFTGRGLGLAAVLGIVRGHRGTLKVYSELGRGTTFKLLLPAAEGPVEEPPASAETGAAWRGSGLVLVIDDEETVRTVAARMLRMMGFEPLLAIHGREGADIFASRPDEIAAVMLDLTMPVLDGTATLTELRRLRPGVRVLLMSGFTEHDALDRFAGKGLAGFLQKPFRSDELRSALRAMLEPT